MENEATAVKKWEDMSGIRTEKCGLFLSRDGITGATPDRLIGDDGLLEVKTLPKLVRKAAFLAIVGKKTYPLLNNLLEPQSAANADYDAIFRNGLIILSHLQKVFTFIVLSVQRDGETMISYVSRLCEAASKCNYGAFLSRSLRNQCISGVADVETQQ